MKRFGLIVVLMLVLLGQGRVSAADWRDSLALTFNDGRGNTMPYRLFLPEGHDQPNVYRPLILYLHGAGSGGGDNHPEKSAAQYAGRLPLAGGDASGYVGDGPDGRAAES